MIMLRVLGVLGFLLLGFAPACGDSDTSLERRGGPLPSTDADSGAAAAAGSGDGASGAAGATGLVAFCDALKVVHDKCQRCHAEPPENGAPVPFLTYEDFQRPYGESTFKYWEVALGLVEKDIMPYVTLNDPPTSLMPPVQPLTIGEKAVLLGWLKQGALPEGGTDCSP
jgi:hypothetical protein